MLRTLEPQKGAENKNAEADFKNPCSYKMKSVYWIIRYWIEYWILDGVVMDVYAEYGLLWRDSWRRRYRKVLIL